MSVITSLQSIIEEDENLDKRYLDYLPKGFIDIPNIVRSIFDSYQSDENEFPENLVEDHLDLLGQHIDRAFDLSANIFALQEKSVRQTIEAVFINKASPCLEKLDEAEWSAAVNAAWRNSEIAVTEVSPGNDESARILSERARATISVADESIRGDEIRRSLVNGFWRLKRERDESLSELTLSVEAPFNNAIRADELTEIFVDQIKYISRLMHSVQNGLRKYFRIDLPIPDNFESDCLGQVAKWQRDAVRLTKKTNSKQTRFDLTIPLLGEKLLEAAAFDNAFDASGDGVVSVDLTEYFPPWMETARIVGFGVAVANPYSGKQDKTALAENAFFDVAIFPPQDQNISREPLLFDQVRALGSLNGGKTRFHKSIMNINPSGIWRIMVGDKFYTGLRSAEDRTREHVQEIFLLISVMSSTPFIPEEFAFDDQIAARPFSKIMKLL